MALPACDVGESVPALWLFPVFSYLVIKKVGHDLGKYVSSKADS